MSSPPSRSNRIFKQLQHSFRPDYLVVHDDSAKHAGHAGVRGADGETHFRIELISQKFEGLNRVARHRLVTDILAEEFSTGLHALTLDLRSPDEAQAAQDG